MEKITRKPLSEIATLEKLHLNWENWGKEYEQHLQSGKRQGIGQDFSWREGIYPVLRNELAELTKEHCTFCDGYPVGTESKETIEHYEPKANFPLRAYCWDNLYYCCDRCQSEANKRDFQYSLRPDAVDYSFDKYFYFDLGTGELNVMENLSPDDLVRADQFLRRYGINENPKRNQSRKFTYHDIRNHMRQGAESEDGRTRDDFKYRYIYDFVVASTSQESHRP